MRRLLLLVVAGSVVFGACDGSGGSTGAGTSTSTARPSHAADRKLLAAGTLRNEDLPNFRRQAAAESTNADLGELAQGIPQCATFLAGTQDPVARRFSPSLQRNLATVTGLVRVYATAADATRQLDLSRDPSIVGCIQAAYRKAITTSLPSSATLTDVSVSPIAPNDVGDGTYGFRVTATFQSGNATKAAQSDIVGMQVDRVLVTLSLAGTNAAVAEIETRVMPKLASRLRAR